MLMFDEVLTLIEGDGSCPFFRIKLAGQNSIFRPARYRCPFDRRIRRLVLRILGSDESDTDDYVAVQLFGQVDIELLGKNI
ncbi:hypothetical protein [Natronococcus jeotgali]|uniref:Uncharacterized protein n=1 Tax=Natronococcus jeotgali DSM 18795 TaxID=1227498 RepID=L9XQW1_9EURY|nr:hypothetical protein [Natronococcus jeotgali]ELY64194.1 hypothetical protein C492_06722 [Natronococcus jeotgali DSM 18795]